MSLLHTTVTVLSSRGVRSQWTRQNCSPGLIPPSFTVLWTMPWNWEQWRWVCTCVAITFLFLLPTSPLYPSTQTNKSLPLCLLNFSSLFPPLSLHFSLSSNAPLFILHHFFPPSLPPPPFPLLFLSPSSFPSVLSPLPQQQEGVPSTMLPLVAQTSEEENKKSKTKELDVSLISARFIIELLYYNRIG